MASRSHPAALQTTAGAVANADSSKRQASALECKICFALYDETHLPKSLPCGHSFCVDCITVGVNQQLLQQNSSAPCEHWRCPLCHFNTGLANAAVIMKLPTNFSLVDIMNRGSDVIVALCCDCDSAATHSCSSCQQQESLYCHIHALAHASSRRYTGHEIEWIAEAVASEREGYCTLHCTLKHEFYCALHQTLLCCQCLLLHTIQHDCKTSVSDLSTAFNQQLAALESLSLPAAELVEHLKAVATATTMCIDQLNAEELQHHNTIIHECAIVRQALDTRELQLLQMLAKEIERKRSAMQQQHDAAAVRYVAVNELHQQLERLYNLGAQSRVIPALTPLQAGLTAIIQGDRDQFVHESERIMLHITTDCQRLRLLIVTLGSVSSNGDAVLISSNSRHISNDLFKPNSKKEMQQNQQQLQQKQSESTIALPHDHDRSQKWQSKLIRASNTIITGLTHGSLHGYSAKSESNNINNNSHVKPIGSNAADSSVQQSVLRRRSTEDHQAAAIDVGQSDDSSYQNSSNNRQSNYELHQEHSSSQSSSVKSRGYNHDR